ncbi:MAG: hypothetical protein DWQ35_00600 [Planctomycetota bacterium]|nr:MAG: hypothetical protein DWQ35_00600 [Planctomycetota bacterium]REK29835.1 MAG: hypothetical protein DWQ42_02720 [Planctomycetota bacterium]REK47994.1 MAG: hypothetical protein DWQ46_03635 [Planctomycetota bacterium]
MRENVEHAAAAARYRRSVFGDCSERVLSVHKRSADESKLPDVSGPGTLISPWHSFAVLIPFRVSSRRVHKMWSR